MFPLRCAGPRCHLRLLAVSSHWSQSSSAVILSMLQRNNYFDATRLMIGVREVVGYGINGSPNYIDCSDFPFPAIRFREVTPEICALREKEQGDWKKLSIQEKKALYRHSFCQTYSEFQHFTPEWKLSLGVALWTLAVGFAFALVYNQSLKRITPETFDEEHKQAQLRRIIHLQIQPITGISSNWCYASNKWK